MVVGEAMLHSLKQIAESYIPDTSTIDPSGVVIDSASEIATALMHALPWEGSEYSVKQVHTAICELIESIRELRITP